MRRNTHEQPPGYPQINRMQFFHPLRPVLTPTEFEDVEAAYTFSKYGHRNQMRGGGVRYFEHPKAVAWILIHELEVFDWQAIVMALLHDIDEDSFILSRRRIEINFGKVVVRGVQLLTKEPEEGYFRRMRLHGGWRELMVKCADRLHNLRTLYGVNDERKRRQIAETRAEILPIADLLVEKLPAANTWKGEYLKSEIRKECERWEQYLREQQKQP